MNGKRYPEEFKIEAVKQVVDRGHIIKSHDPEYISSNRHTLAPANF